MTDTKTTTQTAVVSMRSDGLWYEEGDAVPFAASAGTMVGTQGVTCVHEPDHDAYINGHCEGVSVIQNPETGNWHEPRYGAEGVVLDSGIQIASAPLFLGHEGRAAEGITDRPAVRVALTFYWREGGFQDNPVGRWAVADTGDDLPRVGDARLVANCRAQYDGERFEVELGLDGNWYAPDDPVTPQFYYE